MESQLPIGSPLARENCGLRPLPVPALHYGQVKTSLATRPQPSQLGVRRDGVPPAGGVYDAPEPGPNQNQLWPGEENLGRYHNQRDEHRAQHVGDGQEDLLRSKVQAGV